MSVAAARRQALVALLAATSVLTACTRDEEAAAARGRRKARMAVAARDRALLQGFVRDADALDARLPSLRRHEIGFVADDTAYIVVGHLAGDTLLALDENVRGPGDVTGQARYVFDGARLRYVALDRMRPRDGRPERLRLALGFDSTQALVASSKNVNDAAVPLDTARDVATLVARAAALRTRVSASARAPAMPAAPRRP